MVNIIKMLAAITTTTITLILFYILYSPTPLVYLTWGLFLFIWLKTVMFLQI